MGRPDHEEDRPRVPEIDPGVNLQSCHSTEQMATSRPCFFSHSFTALLFSESTLPTSSSKVLRGRAAFNPDDESLIAATVQQSERIMRKVDNVYPK
jgi:hypothetical protein